MAATAGDVVAGGLDEDQAAQPVRSALRGEHRGDGAVGVADDVPAPAECLDDAVGVAFGLVGGAGALEEDVLGSACLREQRPGARPG